MDHVIPSTLAKDIAELVKYYNVVEIQPLDMFPYTPLESVTLLELKKIKGFYAI